MNSQIGNPKKEIQIPNTSSIQKEIIRNGNTVKSDTSVLVGKMERRKMSGRPGSNRPPRPWQGRALPNELLPLNKEHLFLGLQI